MRARDWSLAEWAPSPDHRRKLRYALSSAATVVVGQAVLAMAFGGLRWSAGAANLCSFGVAAGASYQLNRAWVWGRTGRSDLWREVVPFWAVAAVGLLASSVGVSVAEDRTEGLTMSHGARTAWVMGGSLASVGLVWVLKFFVLNRFVFDSGDPAPRR